MRYAQSNQAIQQQKKFRKLLISTILVLCLCIVGTAVHLSQRVNNDTYTLSIPRYSSEFVVAVNNDKPLFSQNEIVDESYLSFSDLDLLQRCHAAVACLGDDLFPTQEREGIGMVKPSGWHTVRYDDIIEDHYLYNRCHLIAFMLSGENANEKNLITGTRYLNVSGMLPLENQVHDYIQQTGNHVMYRVTPVYYGNDLVAYGVLMEALSVEDNGAGIKFCRFIYNIQPGIEIDYSTGNSWKS